MPNCSEKQNTFSELMTLQCMFSQGNMHHICFEDAHKTTMIKKNLSCWCDIISSSSAQHFLVERKTPLKTKT